RGGVMSEPAGGPAARAGRGPFAGWPAAAVAVSAAFWGSRLGAADDPPAAALAVGLVRPEEQGAAVLDLFRGARAPHPAAALAAARRGRLAVGSTRDDLRAALDGLDAPPPAGDGLAGVVARLDPAGLRAATALPLRRLSAWLDAVGCAGAEARLGLDGETFA